MGEIINGVEFKDGGRTDVYAPDSDADSDPNDPGIDYEMPDGSHLNVKPNDWLDIDETVLPADDPLWGGSRQVIECQSEVVIIRAYNFAADLYEPIALSPSAIVNNFRRVPRT